MTIAVIPAYNEEKTIEGVLQDVRSFVDEIIVVNDGSTDRTEEIARLSGAKVVSHLLNRGLGAALLTGLVAALERGADLIVTFDADGQHKAEDIPKISSPILKGEADIVIGSRIMGSCGKSPRKNFLCEGMPFTRRIANFLANLITLFFFGAWAGDTQSGLRCFSRYAAGKIEILTNGMEVSSEIIKEVKKNNLKLAEVPIQAIYTKYSLSKGQNLFVGFRTVFKLFLRKIVK